MNFQQLREALVAAGIDPLAVTSNEYDSAETVSRAASDAWKLWHHDDVWDVGAAERGRFVLDTRFETEAEACELLARILLSFPAVEIQTSEQLERSDAITREANERARARIAEMRRQES